MLSQTEGVWGQVDTQGAPYRQMASEAIKGAVKEAGIDHKLIEQAFAGYVYGDSTCGQYALYDAFMTGIPVVNVNNNCSSGSSAIFLARQAVQSGAVECALAFGFEEMQPGALGSHWDDRESPFDNFLKVLDEMDYPDAPLALRCFGAAGHHYMAKYGATADLFAKVAVKTRHHAALSPYALFTSELTVEQVMEAPIMYMDFLTRLMCCPPTCGAGAAVLCSEAFAKKTRYYYRRGNRRPGHGHRYPGHLGLPHQPGGCGHDPARSRTGL